jgi:hypothetical protein
VVPSTGDSSISPDDVLAVLFVDAPILDNEHMGYLDLTVHPDHRGHGIGTALASEGERILAEWDRTTLLVWSVVTRAVSEQTQGTIVDPAGTVALRTDDPVVRFPLDRGYSFSQAERHSLQPLPVPAEVIAEALGEAEAKADGYELVQFVGQPTEDLVEGLAPLFAAMSTDPPLGAVDWRPEVWDVDRVVRAYEQMARGKELYTTLARHVSSGEIVAFTQLKAPYDKPEVVWQENTLVLAQPSWARPRACGSRPPTSRWSRRLARAHAASTRGTPTRTTTCWRSTLGSATTGRASALPGRRFSADACTRCLTQSGRSPDSCIT